MLFFLISCSSSEELSNPYAFVKPDNFPEPSYNVDRNPVTREGFELGRMLFFDPILSVDSTVSCNSCHQQVRSFADGPQHPLSFGVQDRVGKRNAPALTNLAFMNEFFWDGGVNHLDFVPNNAITSEFEMGETLTGVMDKLRNSPLYDSLFREAFGVDEPSLPLLQQALSQFTIMMVSADSRYDRYARREGETLSEAELKGLEAFKVKCASCHAGELFTDMSFRNNGLSVSPDDLGRATITELASDEGKFRVSSLRNVELTPPYMHNAQFETLEEVLDHYVNGIRLSATLDPLVANGIAMTEEEKSNIISFLLTLTDRNFTSDPRFFAP